MAVRTYQSVSTSWYGYPAILIRWSGLLNGDTGSPFRIPAHADVTCQIAGISVAGVGGTVTFEGTLDTATVPATTSYGTLHKVDLTTAVTGVLGTLVQILEHPLQIRPNITAGDANTNYVVDILVVKQWKE